MGNQEFTLYIPDRDVDWRQMSPIQKSSDAMVIIGRGEKNIDNYKVYTQHYELPSNCTSIVFDSTRLDQIGSWKKNKADLSLDTQTNLFLHPGTTVKFGKILSTDFSLDEIEPIVALTGNGNIYFASSSIQENYSGDLADDENLFLDHVLNGIQRRYSKSGNVVFAMYLEHKTSE